MNWQPKDLVTQLNELAEGLPCMGDALGWQDVVLDAAEFIERQLPFSERRAAQIEMQQSGDSPIPVTGRPTHPSLPCAGYDDGPDAA